MVRRKLEREANKICYIFFNVHKKMHRRFSGEDVLEDTPVPIPNTEVKVEIADNSKGTPLVKIGICQI